MTPRLLAISLFLVLTAALVLPGCAGRKPLPDPPYIATGSRYVPIGVKDGHARFWGIEQAAIEARRSLRQQILVSREANLPEDLLALTIRDDYMRAKLDEIVRRARMTRWEYSKSERRAEVEVALDPAEFQREIQAAYNNRPTAQR